MRQTDEEDLWVVYTITLQESRGTPSPMKIVCRQSEWDAMELAQPGRQTLVEANIPNEGAAERLARGTSGDGRKVGYPRRW